MVDIIDNYKEQLKVISDAMNSEIAPFLKKSKVLRHAITGVLNDIKHQIELPKLAKGCQ